MMHRNGIARACRSAVRSPARTCSGSAATIFISTQKSCLFSVTLACALAASWAAHAGSSYLAVWSSDKETIRPASSTPTSSPSSMPIPAPRPTARWSTPRRWSDVAGTNLLNDLGFTGALGLTAKYELPATGIPSNVLNEAHHMSHEPIAVGRHRYLYLGGLISANVFRCDVADPLDIPNCPLVTTAKDVKNFSGVDDFAQAPNGNLLVTYMGAKDLTTPGGLVELGLDGTVVGEYAAAKPGGPTRYMPSSQRGHRYRPAGPSARDRHPPGPGPRGHVGLCRPAQPRDLGDAGRRHRGLRHDGAVLEALGPEGRPDRDRAGAGRQGPRGPVPQQRARRRHVGRTDPSAPAQGRVRRDHGRRVDLVRARRHRCRTRSSA